jgi:hypothetical protein
MSEATIPDNKTMVRVVNVYAAPWLYRGRLQKNEGRPTPYDGAVDDFYELYRDQLPRRIPDDRLTAPLTTRALSVKETEVGRPFSSVAASAELFVLPSNQVVLVVTLALTGVDLSTPDSARRFGLFIDQSMDQLLTIDGALLWDSVRGRVRATPRQARDQSTRRGFELADDQPSQERSESVQEQHQLVFIGADVPFRPAYEITDALLYGKQPRYHSEFVAPRRPDQLNIARIQEDRDPYDAIFVAPHRRRAQAPENMLGIVTPYVSVFAAQDELVVGSVILSTVYAVGTAARFRYIWLDAYNAVLTFRRDNWAAEAGEQTRADLEKLADKLGDLEFDLTFAVEFPLMRIETFQRDLYETMDLENQARTLSEMFTQIGGSLRSELTAIEVREQRLIEQRHKYNAFAAGLLSLVGVPVGFIVAFLGINAREVPNNPPHDPPLSMWDPHFAMAYMIAIGFAFLVVVVIAFPFLQQTGRPLVDREKKSKDSAVRRRRRARRRGWLALVVGALIAAVAGLAFRMHENVFTAMVIPFGGAIMLLAIPLWFPYFLDTRPDKDTGRDRAA